MLLFILKKIKFFIYLIKVFIFKYIKINTNKITTGPALPGVVVVNNIIRRQKLITDTMVRILVNISLLTIHDVRS